MLDLSGTITEAEVLIDGWRVLPPSLPDQPLWRTLVKLAGGGESDFTSSLTPYVVGAYGHSRRDSVVRGFGEALERAALMTLWADINEEGVGERLSEAECRGLVDPARYPATGGWIRARRLTDDSEVAVPRELVDYPSDASGYDPSPSGAASGIGASAAVRAALLEIIERDAVLLAWDLGAAIPRIDLATLPRPASPASFAAQAAIAKLLLSIDTLGATLILGDVPVASRGILCAVAVLVDSGGGGRIRTAVGCNAHDDPWVAVLGAVQEALQLRSLQVDLGPPDAPVSTDQVSDEQTRLDWLSSEHGAAQVLGWASGFAEPRHRPFRETSTEALLTSLADEGGSPICVDLTTRLPPKLLSLGWAVVKLIPVGMQPFRLDERNDWSWNTERRLRVSARWAREGVEITRPSGCGWPHPLP